MAGNLLQQLKEMTVVVADTGDIDSIEQFRPRDATTNPSLIAQAAQMPHYKDVVDGALRWSRNAAGNHTAAVISEAVDRLSVEFGLRILSIVPGRVSTEVDARLSYDIDASITKARKLISQYEAAGISRNRVLIKLASTWEGIKAAERLEREGIHCNLTLLFGEHQAIACAEAGVTLISPFVGRILDWFKKDTGRDSYPANEDPGVLSVTRIYTYYKRFGYKTEVMGASFRKAEQVMRLCGSDLLTISPDILATLAATEGTLVRRLDPVAAKKADLQQIHLAEKDFRFMHNQDPMAVDKLSDGIRKFYADGRKLATFAETLMR